MARLAINMRGVVPAGDFPVYPPGLYTLRATEAKVETSKAGNPTLRLRYEIIDGPNGSQEFAGKTTVRSYALTEAALGFLKRLLLACGITDEQLPADGSIDDQMFIGCVIRANVTQGEFNGKMKNDITELPLDGAGQGPVASQPVPTGFAPPAGFALPPATFAPPQGMVAPSAAPNLGATGWPQGATGAVMAPPPPPPAPRGNAR